MTAPPASRWAVVPGEPRQVPGQAAVDLPPNQRLRGGRLLGPGHVRLRRWTGHR